MGLGHSGPYNGAVNPTTQQFSAYDSHQYSLMSYIVADDPTGQYSSSYPNPGASNYGDSTTCMPLDILAVQRLYGVATTGPLSGGQVFGYNDNVDGLVAGVGIHNYFDFSAITTPVVTLYDTGGGNTLDLSGDHSAETIDLRLGHYSSFAGDIDNLALAHREIRSGKGRERRSASRAIEFATSAKVPVGLLRPIGMAAEEQSRPFSQLQTVVP